MFHFLQGDTQKPNRFNFEGTQEEYHLQYARFTVQDASNSLHQEFIAKTKLNKNFYKGNQWVFDEDLEAFLKDATRQDRNRIKVIHNNIRPMIEQYRGNAIRLSINASAKSISKKAINRREESLGKSLLRTRVAEEFPALGRLMREADKSIGDSEKETREIHANLWVDSYVRTINNLIQYVSELNNMEEKQVKVAQNLGLSGLAVIEGFEHGGDLRYKVVESEEFFFDRSAQEYDLSDSDYMGKCVGMLPTDIFEAYPGLTQAQRDSIESYVSDRQGSNSTLSAITPNETILGNVKVPVCHSYWRDQQKREAGYVLDEYGYPYLIYLGETENPLTGELYKEEDLIDPPDSPKNNRLFKGKRKRSMYLDIIRYCVFIPVGAIANPDNKEDGEKDIALEYGMVDYQDTEWRDLSNVKFPFKCYCWGYVDGEIMSPVDDAISPQRFINRVLSVAESQINNSGGTNIIVDRRAVDPADGEDGLHRDIDQGRPITVDTKGLGVPNTVGSYDATPKQGTYALFNIIPTMEQIIQKDTGVNEGLKGESIGSDQLVGVTQLLIQRGSLMQEPFYNALAQVFLQSHQYTASVGKRMYIDNQRELAIAVGDTGVEILNLSEDMKNEDFRVFIKRENDREQLIAQGDSMLRIFLEIGMIDEVVFSNNFGSSTPEDVTMILREEAAKKVELRRQQAKQAQQDAERQAAQLAQQEQNNQQFIDQMKVDRTIEKMQDHNNELEKIALKGELANQGKNNNVV